MLLLNNVKTSKCCTNGSISIHLMLLLNTTAPKEVTKLLFISIHLMLLLNGCGKTMVMTQIAYFNTSYVVIKL